MKYDSAISGNDPIVGHEEGCGAHDGYRCDCTAINRSLLTPQALSKMLSETAMGAAKAALAGINNRKSIMTHDDRVTGLLQANNHMVELCRALKAQLRKSHALFTRYGAEHNKKADAFEEAGKTEEAESSRAKAVTNEVAALEIEVLLAQH